MTRQLDRDTKKREPSFIGILCRKQAIYLSGRRSAGFLVANCDPEDLSQKITSKLSTNSCSHEYVWITYLNLLTIFRVMFYLR